MKNIVCILAIIMALIFSGITNDVDAQQAEVRVYWYEDCPDTCTSHETCTYLVEYAIVNYCENPPIVECSGSTWVNCSTDEAFFNCTVDCEGATSNPCFVVLGRATKFCNGSGGNIAICSGSGDEFRTCLDLITYTTEVLIEW